MRPQVTLYPPGTRIDHYRIMRYIGRGGMGEVYLARDTELGRKVALKLLHPHRSQSNRARKRFLHEARATATFNHPHIITIHSIGEFRARPYVALEYLEGEDLRQRLQLEPPSTKEALRIALAITEALEEAHRHDLLHRDLKPSNIFLPRDGRLRVLDFGLAAQSTTTQITPQPPQTATPKTPPLAFDTQTAGPTQTGSDEDRQPLLTNTPLHHAGEGTPAYMAPEQWSSQKNTKATDIWAIGVILYELLTTSRPYSSSTLTREELREQVTSTSPTPWHDALKSQPDALQSLLKQCLSKSPGERPNATIVKQQLQQLLHDKVGLSEPTHSPFRGLLPFRERHASLFFGRSREIDAFVEELRDVPLLPIVGPSGAGKSSFLQAGVIPRLREQGQWEILWCRPRQRPFSQLARCLLTNEPSQTKETPGGELTPHAITPIPTSGEDALALLAQQLRDDKATLFRHLHQRAEQQGRRVLLVVDQLEELFTLASHTQAEEEAQKHFLESLCLAADDAQDPIRVALTLRDDFLHRLHLSPMVSQACRRLHVLNEPDAASIEEMLCQPLALTGYTIDDKQLLDALTQDALSRSAPLPLLQFTARMLWDKRDRDARQIRWEAYREIGGIGGALAKHADGLLHQMPHQRVQTVKRMLLRLITPSQTRGLLQPGVLLDGLDPHASELLEQLIHARLLVVRKGSHDEHNAEVELAHESLIDSWGQLRRWLNESDDERQFVAEVEQAAQLWQRRGERETELWQGAALTDAQRRQSRSSLPLTTLARRFLQVAGKRDEQQRKRRLTLAIAGFAILLAITIGAVTLSVALFGAKSKADQQRQLARYRLATALLEEGKVHRRTNAYRARARLRQALEIKDSLTARFHWWKQQKRSFYGHIEIGVALYDVALEPKGRWAAIAGQSKTLYIVDLLTMTLRKQRGPTQQLYRLCFTRDGRHIITAGRFGELGTYDRQTKRWTRWQNTPRKRITAIDLHPNGRWLAVGGSQRKIELWNWRQARRIRQMGTMGAGTVLRYMPDGTLLTSNVANLSLWHNQTRRWHRKLNRHVTSNIVYYEKEKAVLIAHTDNRVRAWALSDGSERWSLPAQPRRIAALALPTQQDVLFMGGKHWRPVAWHLKTKQKHCKFPNTRGNTTGAVFSKNGRFVITASWSGRTNVLDVRTTPNPTQKHPPNAPGTDLAFTPDSTTLFSSHWDSRGYQWDIKSGEITRRLYGHRDGVMSVTTHPDGKRFATGSQDATIRIWTIGSRKQPRILKGHKHSVRCVRFSPDGRWLASAGYDKRIRIWNTRDWRRVASYKGHTKRIWRLAWCPDSRCIASTSKDGTIRIWDTDTGAMLHTLLVPNRAPFSVAFRPDGRQLTTNSKHKLLLWDRVDKNGRTQWKQRVLGRLKGRIYQVEYHPTKPYLASASSQGAHLWSWQKSEPFVVAKTHKDVNAIAFSPNGSILAGTGDDSLVWLWKLDQKQLRATPHWRTILLHAKQRAQLLTQNGWQRLDGPTQLNPATTQRWTKRLTQGTKEASLAPTPATHLCVLDDDGTVEIWDTTSDKRLSQRHTKGVQQILATTAGCMLRKQKRMLHEYLPTKQDHGRATERRAKQPIVFLSRDKHHLFWSDGATLHQMKANHKGSFSTTQTRLPSGVTAVTGFDKGLVLGFDNGILRWKSNQRTFHFHGPYPLPITALKKGPKGLLAVIYRGGFLVLRSLHTGEVLYKQRFHGTPKHIAFHKRSLHIASTHGHHDTVDLTLILTPYCDLMRQIWHEVPTIWQGTSLLQKAPPQHHPCRRQFTPQEHPFVSSIVPREPK